MKQAILGCYVKLVICVILLMFSWTVNAAGILIQGAMDVELQEYIQKLQNVVQKNIDGFQFWLGNLEGVPVIISKTNIGEINAGVATTLAIRSFTPDLIINQGLIGGYPRSLHRDDIVVANKIINASAVTAPNLPAGSGVFFKQIDESRDYMPTYFTPPINLVALVANNFEVKGYRVKVGAILSSDRWSNEVDYVSWFSRKYDIFGEEMEGAASAQVAQMYKIPFLSVRVVSNSLLNNESYQETTAQTGQSYILALLPKIAALYKIQLVETTH